MLGELDASGELQRAFVGSEGLVILALLVGGGALLIALDNVLETLRRCKGRSKEE
jgi:hypothetical protein